MGKRPDNGKVNTTDLGATVFPIIVASAAAVVGKRVKSTRTKSREGKEKETASKSSEHGTTENSTEGDCIKCSVVARKRKKEKWHEGRIGKREHNADAPAAVEINEVEQAGIGYYYNSIIPTAHARTPSPFIQRRQQGKR